MTRSYVFHIPDLILVFSPPSRFAAGLLVESAPKVQLRLSTLTIDILQYMVINSYPPPRESG